MGSNIDALIDRIAADSRCELVQRDAKEPLLPPGHRVYHTANGPLPKKMGVTLPEDMLRFRDKIASAKIYAKTVPGGTIPEPNGWELSDIGYWGFETITDRLDDYEPGAIWDQLTQSFIFACKATDGAHLLAVDLRRERYGYIVECFATQQTYGGDVPVVARSFSEWLERTLDAGPLIDCGYWEEPGFLDYGSALDGDPCYDIRPRDPRGATAGRAEMLRAMNWDNS